MITPKFKKEPLFEGAIPAVLLLTSGRRKLRQWAAEWERLLGETEELLERYRDLPVSSAVFRELCADRLATQQRLEYIANLKLFSLEAWRPLKDAEWSKR